MSDERPNGDPEKMRSARDVCNAIYEAAGLSDELEHIRQYHLDNLAAAFKDGRLDAVVDALSYCYEHRIAPPSWVITATEKLLTVLAEKPKRGRGGRVKDAQHYERWERVMLTMATKGLSVEEAALQVAEELEAGPEPLSDASLRRSYYYIERSQKAGKGARFYPYTNRRGEVV